MFKCVYQASANGVCNNNLASVKAASYFSLQKNFIADIVEKAGPAVVFIEIKGRHPVSGKRVTIANGSGFIVRPNGLILTNAHVVANKPTVNVKLHDGSNYEGTKKMTVIPLGKSSTIRPGEFVAALGSPLSLHKTATIGIVSSYLRGSKELGMNNSDMEYIQTDATISLGNSGGPLVNLDSKAIGINTLKLTEGISFAIPSDYALPLLEKADNLISKNASKKPNYLPNGKDSSKGRYVGLTMLPLTGPIIMELKEKYHEFPEINEGVFIHKVVVSSPAYTAGLHAGDIIININDIKVSTSADVYNILEKHDTLKVTVYRGKHKERYTVHTETL
ncbi:Serine protease htra2, mitochondrial [Bulinus truncatus]|nr:Serine protease htra2, mitochondrial [Bulinus truncatus]